MSLIDTIFIISTMLLSVQLTLTLKCRTKIALTITSFLLLLIVIQLFIEGFYWQFIPVYCFIMAYFVITIPWQRFIANSKLIVRSLFRLSLITLLAGLLALWVFLPVPKLLKPNGPYTVGTTTYRWVDTQRAETATLDPNDKRNVIVQAWYPIDPETEGEHSIYIDGLGQLPQFVSLIPGVFMQQYAQIDTHSILDAPISQKQAKWPVILFSPGYGAPRAFYTSLVSNLTSQGYVVLAIDHPYEVAVTELADGTIATPIENFPTNDADALIYMSDQLDKRADDLKFVIAQISEPSVSGETITGHLDTERIVAIGHSFGGATAAAVLAQDSGIKAAVNIDGTLYGDLPTKRLEQPFMLIQSDYSETGHSEQFFVGNTALLHNSTSTAYHYEIMQANHYSFTDAPLFFSWPTRIILSWFIGGSRGAKETLQVTTDTIVAFLEESFGRHHIQIEDVTQNYKNIRGGSLDSGN